MCSRLSVQQSAGHPTAGGRYSRTPTAQGEPLCVTTAEHSTLGQTPGSMLWEAHPNCSLVLPRSWTHCLVPSAASRLADSPQQCHKAAPMQRPRDMRGARRISRNGPVGIHPAHGEGAARSQPRAAQRHRVTGAPGGSSGRANRISGCGLAWPRASELHRRFPSPSAMAGPPLKRLCTTGRSVWHGHAWRGQPRPARHDRPERCPVSPQRGSRACPVANGPSAPIGTLRDG